MRERFSGSMVALAIAAAVGSAVISVPVVRTSAQTPTARSAAPKTPWGEPDLQGIWTAEFDTPLQRPAKYANQEFFTRAQREELDQQRGALLSIDPRQERGSAVDHKACRRAHVFGCRSAQRSDSAADAAGSAGRCGRSGVSPRAVAVDARVQDQGAGVCRRQVRSDALAAICGTPSSLPCGQLRAPQSQRRSGRRRVGGSVPAQRAA